ncbi:RCC1 and BTB domain-containing protein 1 [Camponotus floridanus]|uniref:RCC1 and BTB domain-containing protein 1 n=1 Tax=Camponotus floridanus TaxID=104421 RepID=UPI00059D9C7F|nr:RCC1 and BTB domain-containing protein 1 [Camponotus floridanus]
MSFLERNRVIKYKSLSDLEKKWQFFIFLQPEFISQIHMIMAFNDNAAMIVTKDKMVYGLGYNGHGLLGINDENDIFPPKKIEELCGKNIKTFCCYDSCSPVFALTEEGKIYSWGSNIDRKLGLDLKPSRKIYLPTKVINEECIDIACSSDHALALTKDGKIYTWGTEKYEQFLNEGASYRGVATISIGFPYEVKFNCETEKIICIACGVMFNVVITDNGKVYSWGLNGGRLGLGHYEKKLSPCLIFSLVDVKIVKVVCGAMFTLALTDKGEVYSWGVGLYSKREMNPTKVNMSKIGKVSDIAAQYNMGAAFDENGNVFIWGKYFDQEVSFITQLSNISDIFKYNVSYIINNSIDYDNTKGKSNILECLEEAFNDSSTSDLTIQVEKQSIHVHKAILMIRCQYYRNMFKYNWKENDQNIITQDQFSYNVYKAFLEYLYTGIINLPSEKVLELAQLADAYGETNLKENCVLLIKQTITVSNVAMIYKEAVQYNSQEVEEICFQFALDHLTDMVQTENFINLNEDIKTNFLIKAAKVGAFKK